MGEEIIAHRELVRDMPDRSRIVATLKVSRIGSDPFPYFSATAWMYEAHGTWSGATCHRYQREPDIGGTIHDEIVRAFPHAAGFVAMHLSDWPSGEPMHAASNAAYFYFDRHLSYEAARILRCSVDDLPTCANDETGRAEFAAFVDAQCDRWAREASAAMAWLEALPDPSGS